MSTGIPLRAWSRFPLLRRLLLVGLILTLGACYPGTVDNITELDLILTNFNAEFDFGSVHSYSMPDSFIDIAKLINPDLDGELDQSQSATIIGWIEAEMTARGYLRVPVLEGGTPPDFFLLPGVIKSTTVVVEPGWTFRMNPYLCGMLIHNI